VLRIGCGGEYIGLRGRDNKEVEKTTYEEPNDLYPSPNIIWVIKSRMRWVGQVALCGGDVYTVGKPEGKRPLGRSRRRWEDNFKMDLKEMGWGRGMD